MKTHANDYPETLERCYYNYYDFACEVYNILNERGLTDYRFHYSQTDWGFSVYFTGMKETQHGWENLKVRISDHSVTNRYRMTEEVCFRFSDNPADIADVIERFYFPERFEKKQIGTRYFRIIDGQRGNEVSVCSTVVDDKAWVEYENHQMNEIELNRIIAAGARIISKTYLRTSKSGFAVYDVKFQLNLAVMVVPIYTYIRK